MSNIDYDSDTVVPGLTAAEDGLPPTGNPHNGGPTDPDIDGVLDDRDGDTDDNIDGTRKTSKGVKDTSGELDDEEDDARRRAGDIDTKLSSDSGTPTTAQPMSMSQPQQSMQQPQMPQVQMPQTQMPQASNYTMPASMLKDLVGNYKPSNDSKLADVTGGKPGDTTGAGTSGKDKLAPGDVSFAKNEKDVLTPGEISRTIDKAMDANGIKDPQARAQWKEVLTFMAKHESSFGANAVNTRDSNARNYPDGPWASVRASDGHPTMCSRGIWQTIPSTFAEHHVAGTSKSIYDPVASAAAAIRYSSREYNVDLNGGASLDAFYAKRMRGGYTGY